MALKGMGTILPGMLGVVGCAIVTTMSLGDLKWRRRFDVICVRHPVCCRQSGDSA